MGALAAPQLVDPLDVERVDEQVEVGVRRDDAFVAVGGGVVTDVAGFAAATLLSALASGHVAVSLAASKGLWLTAALYVTANAGFWMIVAGPPPFAFWERNIQWRSADRFGSGSFDLTDGLVIEERDPGQGRGRAR